MEVADVHGREGVRPAALPTGPGGRTEPAVPPRLAPAMTGLGGALVAVGGIGTWIRATSIPLGTSTPEQVGVVAGRSGSAGWILLGIGLVSLVAASAWLARAARTRAIAPALSGLAILFASVRLVLVDRRAASMAEEAAGRGGIDSFHAGFGWGAWLLLVGVVLLALGLLAGGLRELDLRRGR